MELKTSKQNIALFGATAIASFASHPDGFRQKNMLFLFELFVNWIESSAMSLGLNVQATQVSRYLDKLAKEGYARKKRSKTYPTYHLTRTGLLELMSQIVNQQYTEVRSYFFFFFYFVKNYKPLIEKLVIEQGSLFPKTLKFELDLHLDEKAFLKREIEAANRELKRLEIRISDSYATRELIKKCDNSKESFLETIAKVEDLYPYELNSQKPLSELIGELPNPLQIWELEHGSYFRVKEMWEPALEQLKLYILQLEKLPESFD